MKVLVPVVAFIAAIAVAGCSSSDSSPTSAPTKAATAAATPVTKVAVNLKEWSISPSVATAKAGAVTFNVKNDGPKYGHEFVILKTGLAASDLPRKADGSVDEEGTGVESPGEVGDLPVGGQDSSTIELTPGRYLFVCNLVDQSDSGAQLHFKNGMFTEFTVQ